jgi:Bifunctional DNA primase/polymerase, N-terminal
MRKAAAILDTALELWAQGYAPQWLRPRSKVPIDRKWSVAPLMSLEALRVSYRPTYNVGIRCGQYSTPMPGMGLVVIDTDVKVAAYAPEAHKVLSELLEGNTAGPAVRSGRGNGSRHDWRACPLNRLPPKASVLVRKAEESWIPAGKDRPEPVWHIEVLSTGKQVVVPPSIHPATGHRYEWMTPLGPLPLLPESVHAAVDEVLATSVCFRPYDDACRLMGQRASIGGRPGDDFNRRADWQAILLPHGWVPVYHRSDMICWRRPGKREGQSATTNFARSGLFHVFTSNAPPFEADTSYTPFSAYALLEHGGDFKAAARALQQEGYGVQRRHGVRTFDVFPALSSLRTIAAREVLAWRR